MTARTQVWIGDWSADRCGAADGGWLSNKISDTAQTCSANDTFDAPNYAVCINGEENSLH